MGHGPLKPWNGAPADPSKESKEEKAARKAREKALAAESKAQAKEDKKKIRGVKRTSGAFLAVSVLAHILLGAGATYVVVQHIHAKRKITFQAGPPAPQATQTREYKVEVQHHDATAAPELDRRITTTSVSAVALPDAPAMPSMDSASAPSASRATDSPSTQFEVAAVDQSSLLSNLSVFGGNAKGLGLEGTFYDLKQTPDRKPTGMTLDKYSATLQEFNSKGWDPKFLDQFFKGPRPVYLPQVWIPVLSADEGPAAFGLAQLVEPKMWIVVYRGRIAAPAAGRYRLIGFGDDVLAVRLNGQLVLDGGIARVGQVDGGDQPFLYRVNWRKDLPPKQDERRLAVGSWFDIKYSDTPQIEVMIGEKPGGVFMEWILVQKDGDKYQMTADGSPILPVFRLSKFSPAVDKSKVPPFNNDNSEPWKILEGDAPSLLDDLK